MTLNYPGAGARAHASAKTRIAFVDIGRAVAALLVFYSHIAEPWIKARGEHAPYVDVVEHLTSEPLHMAAQGIGQIAVPLFFLISGFVVTPIALKQGQARFGVNRLIRVYAPLIFTVALTAALLLLHLDVPSSGDPQPVNPATVLTNATLVNYLTLPQVALVPVAWTLVVEVMFYLWLILLLPLLRRSVWLTIGLELTMVFVTLMSAKQFGPVWFLVAVNVSYLPILLIGQIIWATSTGKIRLWTAGVFLATAWSLYVLADRLGMGRIDDSYNLALAFAVVCFLMGMFAEPMLRERRIWIALSERAYSIYLLHMLGSFVLLGLLRPQVPLPIALVIAVAGTFGIVEISYRSVERPSHRLARRLSGPRRAEPEPAGAQPPPPAASGLSRAAAPLANEVTLELAAVTAPLPRAGSGVNRADGVRPHRVQPQPGRRPARHRPSR